MSSSRQLAAIMFTDIVGYTALMGNDEKKAFELLKKNKEIQKPIIEEFNGKFIKELGDGILASFPTVSDALFAAIKIQQACSASKQLSLRIGIHQGEIIFENNDIYGDAVNIASRIQTLGIPGSILFSKKVTEEIKNKAEFSMVSLGRFEFKNVKEPIEVFALANEGFPVPKRSRMEGKLKKKNAQRRNVIATFSIILFIAAVFFMYKKFLPQNDKTQVTDKSIAVLPFVDMSAGKDQEYFSDGLSEELLNLLSKITELKVIGRTSSFSFKGKKEDLRIIGDKLGVAYILEGSVQKEGNKIRVTAQLIRTADGSHLWSEKYDRDLEGLFKLQDEIAAAVVKQLKLKLLTAPSSVVSSANIEVHNFILQGNYFHDKLDKENLQKSVDFYQQALAIDSTDGKAWAYLANSLSRMAWNNDIDQLTGYEQAREAALKAIAFDANIAAGYRALGAIKFYHDFDWKGSKEGFEKALNIEPSNAEVLSVYSVWHQVMGDYTKAISLTKEALSNDPLKPLYYLIYGGNLTNASRHEDAIAMFKKVLELNPHSSGANYLIGRNYILMGKPEKALAFISNEPFQLSKQMGYNLYYHATGRKKEADESLVNFINEYHDVWPYNIAVIYGFRGDKNNTIKWLEKSFKKKDTRLVYIKNDPLLKSVWNDPRYINLLKKMNLPTD